MWLTELDPDQARETINTNQRYAAWRDAAGRAQGFRGSLTWHFVNAEDYLTRSYYDSAGKRRQKVEGRRSTETEHVKREWERGREAARSRLSATLQSLARQRSMNRALRLGRVPILAARIVRAIDRAGLLGSGLRIVGTNALYAYEAAAGVHVEAGVVATQDVDLLMDARRSLKIVAKEGVLDLIDVLKSVDRTFERTPLAFRAANSDGYLVDLIRPSRDPPWSEEREAIGRSEDDLRSVQIGGLQWLESAPAFEAVAIDEAGAPLRMVTADPRVFAAHKLWLSGQPSREPVKRRRDALQARTVAALLNQHLTHLPLAGGGLRMLPKALYDGLCSLSAEAGEGREANL